LEDLRELENYIVVGVEERNNKSREIGAPGAGVMNSLIYLQLFL
jgi:hypothetical protein